jgi:membrane-bound serine protease (ClpP class)
MRRLGPLVLLALIALAPFARASAAGRIEVVDVYGVIDANVERAITKNLAQAAREHALLVAVELNSKGAVGAHRAERIAGDIRRSKVPVAVWIGPGGARAQNGAALLWWAAGVRAMAHETSVGPVSTLDLRSTTSVDATARALQPYGASGGRLSSDDAKQSGRAELVADTVGDVIAGLDGRVVHGAKLSVDPQTDQIVLHKLDLAGRVLHGAAQPSIVYLLVLLGLVGVVFEAFHPSTGPAGAAGALALALAVYGLVVLGGSWLGLALIVAGVAGFAVDLRYASLGIFTAAGFAALVAGSVLLFHGPWLRVPPLLLVAGIAAMTAFLIGAMTRVLRDLRLVAAGRLEVRDAHEAVIESANGDGRTT